MADNETICPACRRAGPGQERANDRRSGQDRRQIDRRAVPGVCEGELDTRVLEVVGTWIAYVIANERESNAAHRRYNDLFVRLDAEQRARARTIISNL